MSNKPASASELLNRVWSAMSATWPTLLSMTCAISLITFVTSMLMSFIPAPLDLVASIAVSLFTVVLSCGVVNGTLSYLRCGIISFDHLTSMLPYAKQMICARLWEVLFTFLWMLPGLLCTFISTAILTFAFDSAGIIGVTSIVNSMADGGWGAVIASFIFLTVGVVLTLWLSMRATLNYALSTCFIVDNPNMGGLAALEKSKQAMRGNRWRFVKMSIPMLLMALIISVISSQFAGIMNSLLLSLFTSILTIVPEVMNLYIAPVLYEEALHTEQ